MSSKKYAAPLHLEFTSSRYLFALLLSVHLLSLLLLFLVPLPFFISVLSFFFILLGGVYAIKSHAKRTLPTSIVGLIWDIEDEWFLLQKNGKKILVTLDGNSFIHPLCTILNFKQENHFFTRSLLLLNDNINKNDFRRLRVRLKVTNLNAKPVE